METKSLDLKKLDVGQDESCRAYFYFVSDKSVRMKYKCEHSLDVVAYIREGLPYDMVYNILRKTCVSRKDLLISCISVPDR